jgi:hypothetical protein
VAFPALDCPSFQEPKALATSHESGRDVELKTRRAAMDAAQFVSICENLFISKFGPQMLDIAVIPWERR